MWYVIDTVKDSIVYRFSGDIKPDVNDNSNRKCIDGPDTSGLKLSEVYYSNGTIKATENKRGFSKNNPLSIFFFDSHINILAGKKSIPADGNSSTEITIRNEKKNKSLKKESIKVDVGTDKGLLAADHLGYPTGTEKMSITLKSGTEDITLFSEEYPSGTGSVTATVKARPQNSVSEDAKPDKINIDFLG